MTTGIYCIENIINGKKYIGKGFDFEKERWKRHKYLLNSNKHWNLHLQSAWNKYGEKNFLFWIVEECEKNNAVLSDREIYYISLWDTVHKGYNETSGGEGISGFSHSNESKKRMAEIKTGKKASNETKRRMSLVKTGKIASDETKKKMSIWQKGKKKSEVTRIKISKAHRGKKASDRTKKKMSDSHKAYWEKKKSAQ